MNTAADVTDLILAKQKIEESEQRFRLLADSMPQFVWAADSDGKLNYFNQAVYEFSGRTEEEMLDAGWLNIIHPDEREPNMKKWEHSVKTGEDFIFHHRFQNSKGEYRWQLSRAVPQKDSDGNIQMWIGTSTDIHEHKLVEEELTNKVKLTTEELASSQNQIQESAARLRAVFNHAQSGMFIFAPEKNAEGDLIDFRFVITNPTFASYVGQTPEILNGDLGSKWFPGYMENGVFEMYKKTYVTGESQRTDMHYNVDQLDIYLDLQSIKMGDEVLVTFTDYTQLKMAQFQLERSVEDLKRSNANLEDFAYAASHDLKEPIRKIHYFSDKIRNSISDRFNPEETKYLERMEAAAKRMGSLIDDLLSYSQVSVKPRMLEEVDLDNVIKQVLGDLEIEIEEKKAEILVGEMPVIMGHQRQVQQAFQNLLSNAIKFHKAGSLPVVEVRSKKVPGADLGLNRSFEDQQKYFYMIEVKDNGIGFEQSDAERIFNVFTRLHGNIEYSGTGIGLSIVRKVMENHNGFVFSNGEPGKGATFTVVFPA
jgi:PAS domain S-box-containing protein